mgnify:CR=1 FL=1
MLRQGRARGGAGRGAAPALHGAAARRAAVRGAALLLRDTSSAWAAQVVCACSRNGSKEHGGTLAGAATAAPPPPLHTLHAHVLLEREANFDIRRVLLCHEGHGRTLRAEGCAGHAARRACTTSARPRAGAEPNRDQGQHGVLPRDERARDTNFESRAEPAASCGPAVVRQSKAGGPELNCKYTGNG